MKRCTLSVHKVVSCYIRVMEFALQNQVMEIEEDINIDIEMNEKINKKKLIKITFYRIIRVLKAIWRMM